LYPFSLSPSPSIMGGDLTGSEPRHLASSSVARGRGKNKRIWTYYEDEELIKALYEISLDPKWKSEGDFKNGYCSVLENELKARLPGCGLSAIPHIESRKQQYEAHCKDNPDAKGLYGIAFPHFDTLAAIYGKDIATGEGVEGLGEAVPNQMTMLFALPETLRREFILNMIA
ncbi:hypothetical protein ACJX0J_010048, partial [Zea mays]